MPRMDGERVATLRKAKGWTQQELAVRAGIHAQTISEVERGYRPRKWRRTVTAIANALGADLDRLLLDDDRPVTTTT